MTSLMKTLFRRASRAYFVLQETHSLPRASADPLIHGAMVATAEMHRQRRHGFHTYLLDYPSLANIEILADWHAAKNGTMVLKYTNSIFAPGELCVQNCDADRGVLIALPGFHTTGSEILSDGNHGQFLGSFAAFNGLGLAAWDWPLQGARLQKCMYHGLSSIYSAEREYSRILPALGTSLWREFIAELTFSLAQIRRLVGPNKALHVMGWSMGGSFAYCAPLLGTDIATTIAAGSCAIIQDLLQLHQVRIHGFFFFPNNVLGYFDLDDIVADVSASNTPLLVIHGDQDPGCLAVSRNRLQEVVLEKGSEAVQFIVLEDHGHDLSELLKIHCSNFLQGTFRSPASPIHK